MAHPENANKKRLSFSLSLVYLVMRPEGLEPPLQPPVRQDDDNRDCIITRIAI